MLFDDVTCLESEFQKVGIATEKPWVLILGTDNKWKPDERSSLDLGAKENMEIILGKQFWTHWSLRLSLDGMLYRWKLQ